MKHLKKLASLLLALVMVLSLATTAFAADDGDTDNGKITINDAIAGQTYTIYQILDLESYNETAKAYSYKATAEWKSFVEGTSVKDIYLVTDDQGYVTWKESADVAEFAKLAKTFAASLTSNQGQKVAESTTVIFDNLDLGYYLIDTTLGTICSLDTTNNEVTMEEKNEEPTQEKEVKEDSTGNFGTENTAQVGDKVEFKITVHAKPGALNYVVHDEMSEGLTFNNDVVVTAGSTTLTAGTDYTVTTSNLGDTCDFHITFAQTYLNSITANTDIVITYSATLNDKAVISTDANTNKSKLDYSNKDNTSTEWDETKTYAFKFDLVKTDSSNKVLDGAEFELYDAQKDGNKIALVKESDGTYRIATKAEYEAEGFTSAVIETTNGQAVIEGLDANTTYWLEEIEAPAGYNKLPGRVEVEIENANLTGTVVDNAWTEGGVHVINNAGSELPSTGGMGTTIFYVLGAVLMLGAAVILITKRRMSVR